MWLPSASVRGDSDVVENVGAIWVPLCVAIDMWLKPSCNIIQTGECNTPISTATEVGLS